MLSGSVANALELKHDQRLTSTIEFVRKIDKVFDILNVKACGEGNRTGNLKNPISQVQMMQGSR